MMISPMNWRLKELLYIITLAGTFRFVFTALATIIYSRSFPVSYNNSVVIVG
jgi:hypothetical protein